jgi:hypothetical protein
MQNRRRLLWTVGILALLLAGGALWIQKVIEEQPTEHEDPGIPDVPDLPDPDDVE